MSEDLAFRIQLGLLLPKMKEKIAGDFSTIVDELVDILKAGTREGEELSLEPVKEIIMKDFEIFLDDCILPDVEAKLKPPEEEKKAEEVEEAEESVSETTESLDNGGIFFPGSSQGGNGSKAGGGQVCGGSV